MIACRTNPSEKPLSLIPDLQVGTSGPTSRRSLARKCVIFHSLRARALSYVSPIRQFALWNSVLSVQGGFLKPNPKTVFLAVDLVLPGLSCCAPYISDRPDSETGRLAHPQRRSAVRLPRQCHSQAAEFENGTQRAASLLKQFSAYLYSWLKNKDVCVRIT